MSSTDRHRKFLVREHQVAPEQWEQFDRLQPIQLAQVTRAVALDKAERLAEASHVPMRFDGMSADELIDFCERHDRPAPTTLGEAGIPMKEADVPVAESEVSGQISAKLARMSSVDQAEIRAEAIHRLREAGLAPRRDLPTSAYVEQVATLGLTRESVDGPESAAPVPEGAKQPCETCDGDGLVNGELCDNCHGSGFEPTSHSSDLRTATGSADVRPGRTESAGTLSDPTREAAVPLATFEQQLIAAGFSENAVRPGDPEDAFAAIPRKAAGRI